MSQLPVGGHKIAGYNLYTCGVEVEAANWGTLADSARDGGNLNIGGVKGKFVHDGSVTSGLEWVSAPMQAKPKTGTIDLVTGLLNIADALETNNITYDRTCGYHVHVDARDWSVWELVKVWNNFIHIQDVVYRFGHPDREAINPRRNRTYCNRYEPQLAKVLYRLLTKGTSAVKEWMYDTLYTVNTGVFNDTIRRQRRTNGPRPRYNATGGPNINLGMTPQALDSLKKYKYHNNRYYGFNIMPWHNQGTVEFRSQGFPLNTNDIVMWPMLVCQITNRLLNGELLRKELSNFDEFLTWLQAPDAIRDYAIEKYTKYQNDWQTTLVRPNYERLV